MRKRGFLEDSDGNMSSSRLCLITGVFTLTAVVMYMAFKGTLDTGIVATYATMCTGSYVGGKVTDDWKK